MLVDVITVSWLGGHRLRVSFDDQTTGEVDLKNHLTFEGVFGPLKDPVIFGKVRVNPELGTLCWENGADLDSLVLYSWVTGKPIPEYRQAAPLRAASKVA